MPQLPSGVIKTAPVRGILGAALLTGTAASIASSIALALRGRSELCDGAAPLNGPSQWVLGTHAPYRNGFSPKYTLLGYAIHHAASIFWATFYEALRRAGPRPTLKTDACLAGAVAAAANVVDFQLTPQRLRPGFEKRLSNTSLFIVYAAFAAGLALGARRSSRLR